MGALSGRPVALVTGAAQGIGTAIAHRLAQDGFDVAVTAETELGTVQAAVEGAGRRCLPVVADLRAPTAAADVVAAVGAAWGRLDVLVNNAGWSLSAPLAQLTDDDLSAVVAINLVAPLVAIRAALPLLRRQGGSVVNMSSVQSEHGVPGSAAYAATKGGVNGLTRQLAVELAPDRIRVNAVLPGAIEVARFVEQPGYTSAAAAEAIPWSRQGQPSDVARVVAWLASPESEFVSGQLIAVDGAASAAWDPDG